MTNRPGPRAAAVVVCALALLGLGAASPAAAVADRTVAFWSMDEPAGATVLRDSSGNGVHGVVGADVTAGTVVAGATAHRFATVLPGEQKAYPGHVDRVPHRAELNPDAGDWSLEIRFRTSYAFGNIVQKGQGGTRGGYVKLQAPGGYPGCLFRGGDGASRTGWANTRVDDGLWHTIRCVRTPTYVEMYLDGVRTSRANGPTGTIANTWDLTVGGKGTCDGVDVTCDYFVGDVDWLRIEKGSGGVANAAPVAALALTCTGLVCDADARGTTDADGAVQRHVVGWGDGTVDDTGSVPAVRHTYPRAGTWPVTLPVTDDRGATSTTTTSVTVAPVPERVSFVGAASVAATTSRPGVALPAVAEGDTLLAFLSQNTTATRTPPTGWTEIASQAGGFGRTTLYRRTAAAGDAGSTAVFGLSAQSKAVLDVVAYRGLAPAAPVTVAAAAPAGLSAVRTTPPVTVGTDLTWALSYWVHGDATTTALAAPAGVTVRAVASGTGSGHLTTLLADSGVTVPRGPSGGLTATAPAASTTATTWTLLLHPAA